MPARVCTDVGARRTSVCDTAAEFDASTLDCDDAVVALREWTAIANAAQSAAALAAARIAECGPPPSAGARDAAEFIAKQTGTTTFKAKERIQAGDRLQQQELTRARAASGALSPEQTIAITDAVAADPRAEQSLLDMADRRALGDLRDQCAQTKAAVTDLAEQERQIHAKRSLRRYTDRDGAEHLHAVGTKRDLARIDRALKPYVDRRFRSARADGVREPLEAYTFDALVDMATSASDGATADDTPQRTRVNNLTVIRVDLEALVRGHPEDDERCEIAGLGPISVDTARDMLGESILKLVITKGIDVLNVTHLGRGPNTAQKIALLWHARGCTREDCPRTERLEYDHKDGYEYRKTRHTRFDETEPLCKPDHDLKTYFGWVLVEGTGKRPMVPPDDPRHPNYKRPPP